MRHPRIATLLCALTISSASAHANDCFSYRILDTAGTDKTQVRNQDGTVAKSQLEAILNRLGGGGWELASQHELRLFREGTDSKPGLMVATLYPNVALFKKRIACPEGQ